jgi:beta-galactosidase
MKPILGTCYYPEHWPIEQWKDDAKRMSDLGLSVVRIGEFSWSRLEPSPGKMHWEWMDQSIDTLADAGLELVLGTPTATPPRWMLDRYPDMLAVDVEGRPRKFGSRRHYCFSHTAYRDESVRIASLMAERYGQHPSLHSWQIDNEYGCHDTVVSYSDAARLAFCAWLASKYSNVDELNRAWGNIFWSMEYDNFDQVDLPNLTVTEANPSHCLDFRRFCSDQVVHYNRAQADAVRAHSSAPLIHNYMGRIVDFDHFKVGDDLEIASWDSYPLGFLLDRSDTSEEWKQRFARQGDPDFQAFHHDLYRAVGKGRWWVMEQQPGPVNWAPNNPAPLPGMVRLWTLEAIAHQAEAVCYFRWRQAPFAQEQMHAGLLRPDSQNSATFPEVEQVAAELAAIGEIEPGNAEVALVFDYESCWAWEVQPQGSGFDYFALNLDFYRGLRRLGLSIDIVAPSAPNLDDYKLVLIQGLMRWPESLLQQIETHPGVVLVGPRTGSKTENFSIPASLPPAIPKFDCKVSYVETLEEGSKRDLLAGGMVHSWVENLETGESVIEETTDGAPVLVRAGSIDYLGAWPDTVAMNRIISGACLRAGVSTFEMPEGVRRRCTASHEFVFNHNAQAVEFEGQQIAAADLRYKSLL